MAKKHLQHIKSSQANKIPTAADLMYGEIAVNYANGSEQLFIKNSNDEIVPFVSGKVIEENEMAIAAGMAQLNEDIENVESSIEELSQTVEDNELVTAGALTQLNEDIENVTSSIENVESRVEELSQTVEDNEYVVAEAIGNIDNNVKTLQTSVNSISSGLEETNANILENEEVTATALNDLLYRVSNLDLENMVSVTWQELVDLKDNHELKAGKFYRITDYNTTTSQENTQSAGHQFDIIVLALSDNQLSEDAYATFNDNDDYFLENGANLNAWKIKYCLDNDTDRFAWAQDNTNEYFPDYWIRYDGDEWIDYTDNKRGKYVFIQFDSETMRLYPTRPDSYPDVIDELDYFQYEDDTMEFNGQTYYVWHKYEKVGSSSVINQDYAILTSTLDIPLGKGGGTGVIYYMMDEWGNEAPYDFKNIQFKRWAITNVTSTVLSSNAISHLNEKFVYTDNGGIHFSAKNFVGDYLPNTTTITTTVDNNNSGWYYTFHGINSNDGQTANDSYDMSTNQFKLTQECIDALDENGYGDNIKDMCYDNSILPLYEEYIINNVYTKGRLVLNNIVFINAFSYCYYSTDYDSWAYNTNKCYANHFENNCAYNTFGSRCIDNTFGVSCINNTFANDCSNNVFGNIFEGNTFGAFCAYNTFGSRCTENTFGEYCTDNKIDNDCLANGIGNSCQYNNIGNTFSNNQTGDSFSANNLLNGITNNIIGDECMDNVFGNEFSNNTFGNNCRNNSFGNDVSYIKALVTNDNTLTATPLDNILFIIIENGNKRINITTTGNTTYNNPLRNIKISQGVNNAIIDGTNNSNWKTISHNTLNDTFRTVYQSANSVTVSV